MEAYFVPSAISALALAIPEAGKVSIVNYDFLGRAIATLADRYRQAGRYSATWSGTQNSGILVSSGIYFTRLFVTNELGIIKYAKTARLLLMR